LKTPAIVGIGSHRMSHACVPAPRLASELGASLIEYDAGHDVQKGAPELFAQFVRSAAEAAKVT